jgi:predicted Fe-Mo cluster-binding NifX family protein
MKIAITSTGNTPEARLDDRFGRCEYFVFYDTEDHSLEYLPNQHKNDVKSAGEESIKLIASKGAQKVISGEFGVKVKNHADRLRIQLVLLPDSDKTIEELIRMLNH